MSAVDWLIVVVPVIFIVGMAFYSRRYIRGVVDFLAAGRVAGRYVMSIGDMAAGLSVITLVAGSEQNYQTGYGVAFWNSVMIPVSLVLALTGYCTYRWREIKCLSKGQFIEMRYGSKSFRMVTAAISTLSEMLTNALGPAIAANFFIYYLGLPHRVMIAGVNLPCYVIIVVMCLVLAMLIIWPAGRVSLLLTDSLQGLMSYPIFVIMVGFVILKFSWDVDIAPILWDRVPQQSFINPYDVQQLRDFNVFALVVNLTSSILNRASWIGNDNSNSGRTPHEQKMAGVFGQFRNGVSQVMVILVAVMVIVFMNSGHFATRSSQNSFAVTNNEVRQELAAKVLQEAVADADRRERVEQRVKAMPILVHQTGVDQPFSQKRNLDAVCFETVRDALGDSPEGRYEFQKFRTLFQQMMMPVTLKNIFPVGLLGLFCLLMVMLLVSTDDSRIFNAAGCLVQDIVLPLCKKKLSPRRHLLLLRLTSLAVAFFFLAVALLFSQLDYINMVVTIMCALWLGGAGPIMIGGLYTRWGNLTGAWCAIVFGSGTSLLGLLCQRNWALVIYPWLERHGWTESADAFLRAVSSPFEPWIHWEISAVKFPINSTEIFFISMALSISGYVVGSLLTYRPYDLDRLLNRTRREEGESEAKSRWWSPMFLFKKIIGITPEYTPMDKVITYLLFIYSFGYQFLGIFVAVVIWNAFEPWPKDWWNAYFYYVTLIVPGIVGIISTVWFLSGGIMDTKRLFRDLAKRKDNPEDNGQVMNDGER